VAAPLNIRLPFARHLLPSCNSVDAGVWTSAVPVVIAGLDVAGRFANSVPGSCSNFAGFGGNQWVKWPELNGARRKSSRTEKYVTLAPPLAVAANCAYVDMPRVVGRPVRPSHEE